ncbi:MAG: ABC transporter ATP-binding protein [Thermoplasmatales archaeon]|nr:ABC transporter ATP-binding protein [Thermoplasmatales archaeon]
MEIENIRIEDMSFGYSKGGLVLEDINLSVSGGQVLSIIGPNGVGKSTLIHCMNKILSPTVGTVFIDGNDVKTTHVKELAKKMGYVPRATGDSFPMTVMDTVLMGKHPGTGHKITNDDVKEAYDLLKLLNIEWLAMRPFNQLSAGQHQKVSIARGLIQNTKIILLDEPTSNLDVKHQMDVARILKERSVEKGIIVVMISHDLNIASKYSDYVLMLYDKKIHALGTPFETITANNIREVYGAESTIVMDEGRPHVILRDPMLKVSDRAPANTICSTKLKPRKALIN